MPQPGLEPGPSDPESSTLTTGLLTPHKAWCLSNHRHFIAMCTFFREVKKNCAGSITSTWFMSDIAPQYNNAWVGFMNDVPRPQKLLCTWHVDKAINMELRKKIGDLSTEAEI